MKIEYAAIEKCKSFREAVKSVCEEEKYLANTTGFTEEQTKDFVEKIVANHYSQFYAIENDKVIGWCDIIPRDQELHKHAGVLGMGIVAGFRNKGIGWQLLQAAINHARSNGIERIELEVYAGNRIAQKLYKKVGFKKEGVKRKGKKLNGKYEDVIIMGLINI
jgi:RimJ/RimL family protein N-acetyltransferase